VLEGIIANLFVPSACGLIQSPPFESVESAWETLLWINNHKVCLTAITLKFNIDE